MYTLIYIFSTFWDFVVLVLVSTQVESISVSHMRPCKILCTYDCHLGSILEYHLKGQKSLRWGVFGLPFTHIVKISQKNKSGTSHITHHTSHITHYIEIFKFYKIFWSKRWWPSTRETVPLQTLDMGKQTVSVIADLFLLPYRANSVYILSVTALGYSRS